MPDKPEIDLEDPDLRRLKKAVLDLQEKTDSIENSLKSLLGLPKELEDLKAQIKNAERSAKDDKKDDDEW